MLVNYKIIWQMLAEVFKSQVKLNIQFKFCLITIWIFYFVRFRIYKCGLKLIHIKKRTKYSQQKLNLFRCSIEKTCMHYCFSTINIAFIWTTKTCAQFNFPSMLSPHDHTGEHIALQAHKFLLWKQNTLNKGINIE